MRLEDVNLTCCRGISAAPAAGPSRLGSGGATVPPAMAAGSSTFVVASPAEATLRPWAEQAAEPGFSAAAGRGDSFTLDPNLQRRPATPPSSAAAAAEASSRLAANGSTFAANGTAAEPRAQPTRRLQDAEQAVGSAKQEADQPAAGRDSLESLKPSTRAADTLGGPEIGLRKTSPPPSPTSADQVDCSVVVFGCSFKPVKFDPGTRFGIQVNMLWTRSADRRSGCARRRHGRHRQLLLHRCAL